jgi:hypothetical protein
MISEFFSIRSHLLFLENVLHKSLIFHLKKFVDVERIFGAEDLTL